MKRIGLFIIGITMVSLSMSQTASPELISSTGNSFNNTTYQLNWSIGECVTATHSEGEYVITQGLHQNSYLVLAVENLRTDIKVSVYPNPTSEFISLKVESSKVEGMQYKVTDFFGKVLQTKNFFGDIEQINFSNYAVGTYFITVSENNQLLKSFKIMKN